MAQIINTKNKKAKAKKHKAPGKFKTFLHNHKKAVLFSSIGVGGAALLVAIVILAYQAVGSVIPYHINLKSYIDVPQYMGITVKNEDITKELDRQKRALLLTYAGYETLTEGIIKEGYKVTVDATGYILKSDGTRSSEAMSNGSLKDYAITDLGNHYTESGTAFSSEIQEALIGKNVDESEKIVAKVTYPDDYSSAELRGRTAEFDITIKKVEKTILPGYTNTFILAKTGYKDIATYEEALEKDIRYNLVWNAVVNSVTVKKFPEDKVTEYRQAFSKPYNEYMEENNMSFDKLLSELKIDEQTYFDQQDAYAYGLVREEMILYYIARKENIKVSDSEYKVLALELAIENGYSSISEFEDSVTEATVERSVLWQKVKTILVTNAVFE